MSTGQLEIQQVIKTFIRIIDIVDLAHRFIAPELEAWALSRLKYLSGFIEGVNAYPISSKSHLKLLNYAKRTSDQDLIRWSRHWIRSYYAWAVENGSVASEAFATSPASKIRDQLVREYKLAMIVQSDNPAIFGYLFCFLLSLGHEFWKKHPGLTREDRITLLGAHVRLSPLPNTLPLSWLDAGKVGGDRSGLSTSLRLCSDCHFSRVWRHNFGGSYREMIGSSAPLAGVFALALLPRRRQKFADETKPLAPKTCTKNCREICLKYIDENADTIFTRLAEFCKEVE